MPRPFQGDCAMQRRVPRPVNDPECSLPDYVPQLIAADAGRWPRHAAGALRFGGLFSRLDRLSSQVRFGHDQVDQGVRIVGDLGEALQVRRQAAGLAGLEPKFHLLMDQLDQHRFSMGDFLGGIRLDRWSFSFPQCITE